MPEERGDDMADQRVRLADGRWLGYRELGDPAGVPLFFFHGTPGSRWSVDAEDPLARMPGVRLILPERPGYGLSTAKPDRRLLDWAHDVAELADRLGIGDLAVAGVSGGGPHALACAAAFPDRVTVAVTLGSPAPAGFPGATRGMSSGNRLGLWLQRFAPGLFRRVMAGNAAAFHRDPQRFLDALAAGMSTSDRKIMQRPEVRTTLIRDLHEAYRQGSDAQIVDGTLAMTATSWGFELPGNAIPVHVWHGAEDRLVTRAMFDRLATEIPDVRAHLIPGAGHLLDTEQSVIDGVRAAVLDHARWPNRRAGSPSARPLPRRRRDRARAAVDSEGRAVQVVRAGEVGDRVRDLRWVQRAAEWEGAGQSFQRRRGGLGARRESRADRDGVHAHTDRAVLRRPGAGEGLEPGLDGAVGGGGRRADPRRDRRDVHDRAAAALDHLRDEGLAEQERGAQVRPNEGVEERLVGQRGGQEAVEAGVVDEDVDVLQRGQGRDPGRLGEVRDHRPGRAIGGRDPGDDFLCLRRVAAGDDHLGAAGGERLRRRPPDAGGRSGDEGRSPMNGYPWAARASVTSIGVPPRPKPSRAVSSMTT